MGDGGLCVGAATLILNEKKKYKNFKLKNMYLGPLLVQTKLRKLVQIFMLRKWRRIIFINLSLQNYIKVV